jgi:energy-coupling factor transport system ATP-binding protein
VIFEANDLVVEHRVARKQSIRAIDGIDIRLNSGEVLGILGSNGAGKSSLLWKLQSLTHAVMVPQQASDLLFLPSVGDEFRESDRYAGVELGTTANLFVQLVGRVDTAMHPRDLSAGRQLALALAVQLVKDSRVILLDEPTRGLDYAAKRALVELLRNLQHEGRAIVVASHDIEFLAAICDRVLTLRAGRVEALRSAEQQFGFGGATEGELAQVSCRPGLIRLSQVEPGPATTVRREASDA